MNCQMNGAGDICLLCIPASFRTVLDSGFGSIISLQFWGAVHQSTMHFFSQGVILGTKACPLDCLPDVTQELKLLMKLLTPLAELFALFDLPWS